MGSNGFAIMNKLTLAVVGCGDIAGYLGSVARLVPAVKLAVCCDINQDSADQYGKRFGISDRVTDFSAVLEDPGIDAVYLAVPHHLHYPMILEAAEAEKHVLVEKPLTRTLAEGRRIVEKSLGVKIGVNYQYRYDRGCYALAKAVQKGQLGRIHSVLIHIPWHRDTNYFRDSKWHASMDKAGGGTLITQGSHFLDIVLWALGEPAVSAMAYTSSPLVDVEVDTLTHGILETKSGTLISIVSSMVSATEEGVSIRVSGELGSGIYKDRPWPRAQFRNVRVHKQPPPGWGVHALQRSLYGFSQWVIKDHPFLTPASEALKVLAAVDGLYRSAESGERESI